MKTAPFDLELAKLGHPLVTKGDIKVLQFDCFDTDCLKSHCARALIDTYPLRIVTYNGYGFARDNRPSTNDLLLDLETPWEKPLQPGDFIVYEDNGAAMAEFIGYHNGKVVVSPVGSDTYKVITVWQRMDPVYHTKITSKLPE